MDSNNKENSCSSSVSRLRKLTEKELITLLEDIMDSANPEPEGALDKVDPILAELDRRDKDKVEFNTEAGWEELKSKHPSFFMEAGQEQRAVSEPITRKAHRTWRPGHLIAASAVTMLLVGTIAVQASGLNLFEVIARWTRDVFYFEPVRTQSLEPYTRYQSLQELIAADNVTAALAPVWFPDGFEVTELSATRGQNGIEYYAVYTDGVDSIGISIESQKHPGAPTWYEKDHGDVPTYTAGGITHYIMQNSGSTTAAWVNEPFECSISTTLPEEIVEKIIDSIYE